MYRYLSHCNAPNNIVNTYIAVGMIDNLEMQSLKSSPRVAVNPEGLKSEGLGPEWSPLWI